MGEVIEKRLKSKVVHKHELEVDWLKSTYTPEKGELIIYDIEVDANGVTLELPNGRDKPYTWQRLKLGDGIHNVNELPFLNTANVPFISGTQTASTGSWTGTTSEISKLVDGQTIRYWLPYNGSGNATLNLTLKDGTTTGAIACYKSGASRLTTHYPAGNIIILTYRENISISGGSTKYTGWWADADYSTTAASVVQYTGTIKCGSTAIVATNIIVGKDGLYSNLKLGNAFDITYPILYAGSAIAASGTGTNNYLIRTLSITATQPITLTNYKPVYIKGQLNGTIFTPISTAPLTQTIPTTDDGYEYILLGVAYSSTALYLLSDHPIFSYKNGIFGQISSHAYTAMNNVPVSSADTGKFMRVVDGKWAAVAVPSAEGVNF